MRTERRFGILPIRVALRTFRVRDDHLPQTNAFSAKEEKAMNKERKSRQELENIVMQEVRKIPDTDDIMGVTVTPRMQTALHHPNWDPAFTMDGNRIPPEPVLRMARELATKFDLA